MTTMTLTTKTDFFVDRCCTCGIEFAYPTDWEHQRRKDHAWFYCPNGHTQHFTAKSDAELLKEEQRRRASAEEDARVQAARAKQAELELQRLAKRAANGVCPCCNRSFVQLTRHMKSKHPDYVP